MSNHYFVYLKLIYHCNLNFFKKLKMLKINTEEIILILNKSKTDMEHDNPI